MRKFANFSTFLNECLTDRADARLERRTVHPCLRIPEIQQLVFSSLRKRDCSRVALACKTFYEEAMDVIWADVESLVPFVRCMPPEILTETTRNGSHGRDVTIVSSYSVAISCLDPLIRD